MGAQRLQHDCAFAAASVLLDMACGALMDSEKRDYHREAYLIVLAVLEKDDLMCEQEEARLRQVVVTCFQLPLGEAVAEGLRAYPNNRKTGTNCPVFWHPRG